MHRACQLAGALLLAAASAFAADIATLRNGFQIRHERREQNGATTRLYLTAAPNGSYIDVPAEQIVLLEHEELPPAPPAASSVPVRDIQELVNAASERHLVDADLIASVIHAESNFDPRAQSPKGALGLMQLMPGTAAQLGVQDAFQPEANIEAGSRYLRDLLLRYNGDVAKALAAYNAGPQRVDQYRGVPPYSETHAYVARVIRDFNRKKLTARAVSAPPSTARSPRAPKKQAGAETSSPKASGPTAPPGAALQIPPPRRASAARMGWHARPGQAGPTPASPDRGL
jgi:soluble lytic murein transglycosylase-like protein